MADELRHLVRYEKKNLVRGWNTGVAQQQSKQQQQSELPNQPGNSSSDDEGDLISAADHQLEPNDRLLQWLREDTVPSSAVSSLWGAQFGDHNQPYNEEDVEDEAIPLTSSQVKHAYRTRARRQEVQDTKRAVEMKAKREMLLGLQSNRTHVAVVSRPKARQKSTRQVGPLVVKSTRTTEVPQPQVNAHDQALADSAEQDQSQQPQDPRLLELKNLPASRICVDSEYRNEILARIRKQLISGRDVLLTSDSTSEEATLSDTKLMMQQLCAQSLVYCVREQEVVPQVDLSRQQRMELLLRTRIPPS